MCPHCRGSGADSIDDVTTCDKCQGQGVIVERKQIGIMKAIGLTDFSIMFMYINMMIMLRWIITAHLKKIKEYGNLNGRLQIISLTIILMDG